MQGLLSGLRARSFQTLAAMLLGIAGLAAVGLESVSFGHVHDGGCAVHHHHFYVGSHEHADDREPGPAPDHDRHPGDDPHDDEAPAPQDRHTSRRTVTVSAAPALFQPAAVAVLAPPPVDLAPVALALVPPRVARRGSRPASPRAPPSLLVSVLSL